MFGNSTLSYFYYESKAKQNTTTSTDLKTMALLRNCVWGGFFRIIRSYMYWQKLH